MFFFFNDTATTEFYTLSLHDALPILLETQEYQNGQWITISARFRVYASFEESIQDHSALLANGTTWNKQQYQHVLASTNYLEAAHNLQRDGYATDPDYTQKIIQIIQKYHLDRYDH